MKDIVVIGAGPGGLAAAYEAGRLGASVTLVESEHIGGRATWHSLLPSKAWLTAADHVAGRAAIARMGVPTTDESVDTSKLIAHIAALKTAVTSRYQARLDRYQVRVIEGSAALENANQVRVETGNGNHTLDADAIIIATGSGPIFLPNVKPDAKRIIAPRLMSRFTQLPSSMIMIGAGVTGMEFAYMFTMLGVAVTVVTDLPTILPRTDADIKSVLQDSLVGHGMKVITSSPVEAAVADDHGVTVTLRNGNTLQADMAFIAIGRRPHLDGLNLEAVGLELIQVNGYGQTAVPSVYAVGDVAGPPMTANKAMAQGYVAARHVMEVPVEPFRTERVIEAVYTEPQIAQVGLTEAEAHTNGLAVSVIRRSYADSLKAHLIGATEGLLKLIVDPGRGSLLGAAAVGSHAVDVLTPLALESECHDLTGVFAGHPTLSELPFDALRDNPGVD